MKRVLVELLIGALMIGGVAVGVNAQAEALRRDRHEQAVTNCITMIYWQQHLKTQAEIAALDGNMRAFNKLRFQAWVAYDQLIHLPTPILKEASEREFGNARIVAGLGD